jgi:hypothetical protein
MKSLFKTVFFIAILISFTSCEKEDLELYEGYIINQSDYTLKVSVIDYQEGDEVHNVTLSPNYQSKMDLEERKYTIKAYRNDGSYYSSTSIFINAIRDDATTPSGDICDWYVILN